MTSKPASRSARATSFAPRSWPSSPGFATRTRTGITFPPASHPLEHRRLLELAPLVLEHVDHLPHRAVRVHALHEARHQVVVVSRRRGAERVERAPHVARGARTLHGGEPLELSEPSLLV